MATVGGRSTVLSCNREHTFMNTLRQAVLGLELTNPSCVGDL